MLRVAEKFGRSDQGRQRSSNEDSKFLRPPLFAVADGMGGARAGEVASSIAVDVLESGLPDSGSDEERLATRVREANQQIHDLAKSDSERAGMGTTLTAAIVGDSAVAIAHVGDSRAYRIRDGELEQVTRDHSLVGELIRQGKLTEKEAEDHPQRSVITRALGPEAAVEVDTWSYPAQDGDVFLLCSDGLTSMVPDDRIAELMQDSGSLEQAGESLIDAANAAGGRDNITVVLFRLEDVPVSGGGDSPTQVGQPAVTPEQVAAAEAAEAAETEPSATPTETSAPRRTAPLPPRPAAEKPPARRRRRGFVPAVVTLAIVGVIAAGGWIASRQVYFVGTNSQGFVTVYEGLPYDGPAGIRLYRTRYASGVAAAELPPARRRSLLDHQLRSRNDADDLVRKLELGQVGR